MIKVSILIPVFNQEKLIKTCLASIPPRDDIEIIVVDDSSTDNTWKVLQSYKNIKCFRNPANWGIGLTRNVLLSHAKGEYIFFLDSDDYIYPDVFNDVMDHDLTKDVIILKCLHKEGHNKIWFPRVHRGDFVKRSFIGKTRHPNLRKAEDTVFRKILEKLPGYKIKYVDKIIYYYNIRENSLSNHKI